MSNDFQEVVDLMKTLGSKEGFDPMPPDQYRWQEVNGNPLLHRLWSKMCSCTIRRGRRSPYAVDRHGNAIDIVGMAKLLTEDAGNVRYAWRQGVAIGLWRNGTKAEGKTKLYLCGAVKAPDSLELGEDKANEKVYTHRLRPYILAQINDLPEKSRASFWQEWNLNQDKRDRLHAELTAAVRLIGDTDDDKLFQRFGVKKIRESHKTSKPEDEEVARRARIQSILPELERYALTVEAELAQTHLAVSVQSKNGDAHTVPSLLCSEQSRDLLPSSSLNTPQPATTTNKNAPVEEKNEPERQANTARDLDWATEAMEQYVGTVEKAVVVEMLRECRAKMPDIETGEILDLIHLKGGMKSLRQKNNPPKYLATAVVNAVYPDAIRRVQAERTENGRRLEAQAKSAADYVAFEEYCEAETGRRIDEMDRGERASRIKLKMAVAKSGLSKLASRDQIAAMAEQLVRAELRPTREEWEQFRSNRSEQSVGGGE